MKRGNGIGPPAAAGRADSWTTRRRQRAGEGGPAGGDGRASRGPGSHSQKEVWHLTSPQTTAPAFAITLDDVRAAAERLQGVANRTPVARSRTLDRLTGRRVVLKCENLQRGGAFKFRGAYNRLVALSTQERERGVVAFSSGNHAQGVALAARELGVQATVVMPTDAPSLKVAATREYGAEIVE